MARVTLGLSDAEFYALTPRQEMILLDRHFERVKHQEFLFGQLTARVVNHSQRHYEEDVVPADFMPSEIGKKPKRRSRKEERERQEAEVMRLRHFFDVKVKVQEMQKERVN